MFLRRLSLSNPPYTGAPDVVTRNEPNATSVSAPLADHEYSHGPRSVEPEVGTVNVYTPVSGWPIGAAELDVPAGSTSVRATVASVSTPSTYARYSSGTP